MVKEAPRRLTEPNHPGLILTSRKTPRKAAIRTPSETLRRGARSMARSSALLASFNRNAARIARMCLAVILPNGAMSRGNDTIATFGQAWSKDDVRRTR